MSKKRVLGMCLIVLCLLSSSFIALAADSVEPCDFGGFGVSVAINQSEYWTDLMPPGWRPPTIYMALKIYNYTSKPVVFYFPTSQRYDFSIYNSKGYEVWRWSAGRVFLQVLGKLELQPGQTITYTESMKFVDKYGSAMPEDLYSLKGELTATDPSLHIRRTMEGKVSFLYKYAY